MQQNVKFSLDYSFLLTQQSTSKTRLRSKLASLNRQQLSTDEINQDLAQITQQETAKLSSSRNNFGLLGKNVAAISFCLLRNDLAFPGSFFLGRNSSQRQDAINEHFWSLKQKTALKENTFGQIFQQCLQSTILLV